MHRLFRKMFLMIWLCTAGSIVLFFVIINWVIANPLAAEIKQSTHTFTLDLAAGFLEKTDPKSAMLVISTAQDIDPSIHLTVTPIGRSAKCSVDDRNPTQRHVASGGTCYLLAADFEPLEFFSLQWPKLIPLASALVAAAAAAFWLANHFAGPIEKLQTGLRELARGRFDVRISSQINGNRDELAALATDFDITAGRMEAFHQSQQRLFHDVSHELRSPLSRLQAGIGILRKNPSRLDAMLDRVDREIERMDGLIDEVLTLAKLTSFELEPLESQTVDLVDLINEIVADGNFEGATKSVDVVYSGEISYVASVDGELIYRAVENVIRNAIKFSPDHSSVSVKTQISTSHFMIVVEDQGPGVPINALGSIFHTFKRIGNGSTNETGFGLGLSITKHAFERHGGTVHAVPAERGGLCIRLILPLSSVDI